MQLLVLDLAHKVEEWLNCMQDLNADLVELQVDTVEVMAKVVNILLDVRKNGQLR